jgi:hypothetical protein
LSDIKPNHHQLLCNFVDRLPAVLLSGQLLEVSIPIYDVTSNPTSMRRKRPVHFARLTSFVLILLVAYTGIGGSTHSHNPSRIDRQIDSSASTFRAPQNDGSSSNTLPGNGECLACQFHQHLFTGLLSVLPHLDPPVSQSFHTATAQIISSSSTAAPRRGRAPPSFS